MNILYNLLSLFIISCSLFVIFSKNPVHSIVYLILTFCGAAALLISIGSEFLGLIFIIVYVGAIAVLFLFVVMMLNIKIIELNENLIRYLPISLIIFFTVTLQIYSYINFTYVNPEFPFIDWLIILNRSQNIVLLGNILYTIFFHFFLITSLILLLAMIGSIVLTLNHSKYVLRQKSYEQNLRNWKTTVRLFHIK